NRIDTEILTRLRRVRMKISWEMRGFFPVRLPTPASKLAGNPVRLRVRMTLVHCMARHLHSVFAMAHVFLRWRSVFAMARRFRLQGVCDDALVPRYFSRLTAGFLRSLTFTAGNTGEVAPRSGVRGSAG